MRVHHATEGRNAAHLAEALNAVVSGKSRIDCLIVFPIRGDERLPASLYPLLRTLTGKRAAFVVIGDYSRPPDASHSVAHGLREWAEPQSEEWITWVDAPITNTNAILRRISTWAEDVAGGALIGRRPTQLPEREIASLLWQRLSSGPRIDLNDGAPYDRSLWGRLGPKEAAKFQEILASDKHMDALNLGWVEPNSLALPIPPQLRVFRARGLGSLDGWLSNSPLLEELVLVGGGLPKFSAPNRTISNLRRLILDKNCLTDLPDGLNDAPMTILSLYRNDFHEVPGVIQRMDRLESLTIGANPIRTLPKWLSKLPSLKAINIANLELDRASDQVIESLGERGINLKTSKTTLGGVPIPTTPLENEFPRLSEF